MKIKTKNKLHTNFTSAFHFITTHFFKQHCHFIPHTHEKQKKTSTKPTPIATKHKKLDLAKVKEAKHSNLKHRALFVLPQHKHTQKKKRGKKRENKTPHFGSKPSTNKRVDELGISGVE